MKSNYVAAGMGYGPAQIAERNEYIDSLCAKVQIFARAAFESAVRRQTAGESAEALAEEARSALLEVLAESADRPQLDEESSRLREALATALKQAPEMLDENEDAVWIERRSKDLARAVVGFWVNLADDETSRYEASIRILDDRLTGKKSERERKFELICSRFWLDQDEARRLLSCLNAGVILREVVTSIRPSVDPENLEELWKEIRPEPSAVTIEAVRRDPEHLAVRVITLRPHAASCEPALDILRVLDRIHHDQLVRIESGTAALRGRRMQAYCSNIAVVQTAIQTAAAFCEKDGV